MNDAERQTELYGSIWKEDPNYGTAPRDVKGTVAHRIAPHLARVFPGFYDGDEIYVVDFGAGDGRFLWEMNEQKLITGAVGVDVYAPPARPGWMRWEQVPMWESRARGNYVISTDALEHIPPARVNDSLRAIANAAPHGFLRISLKEDRYGTARGLHLHESVFSSAVWMNCLMGVGIRPSSYRVYLDAPHTEDALEVWF